MAYISCLPEELNSYVIVQNLSLAGLPFNLPPWITSRKVTAIQLEPYQRCTCSPDSYLLRMGHKSTNCASQSTINIMNNWEGVFKSGKTPVCLPAFDSLLLGIKEDRDAEESRQGRWCGWVVDRNSIQEEKQLSSMVLPLADSCLKTGMFKGDGWR